MKRAIVMIAVLALVGGVASKVTGAEAKVSWEKQCAKCHGADGKGDTKMGKKLKVKDYTDAKVQAELKNEEMFKATKEGVKDKAGKTVMKPAEGLSDQEIKDLVALIRSFKK